jgi:hypothetical protein
MTEAPSTRRVALAWAAKEERQEESSPTRTSFFLFSEGEVRVVVRGSAEKKDSSNDVRSATNGTIVTGVGEQSGVPNRVRRVPQTRLLRSTLDQRYILLKKYEGFVTARGEETFSARLFEGNSDYPVLEAEFDFEELSENDRELAVEGAPMVWTIGYAYEGSTRKRESLIYLRRLPAWNDKELEKARAAAEDLGRAIRWE